MNRWDDDSSAVLESMKKNEMPRVVPALWSSAATRCFLWQDVFGLYLKSFKVGGNASFGDVVVWKPFPDIASYKGESLRSFFDCLP